MRIRTILAVAIVITTALAGAQAATASISLSGTVDTSAASGVPGEAGDSWIYNHQHGRAK